MITAIVGLLGSPILGSAIGFLGSWLKDREARKQQELSFKHQQTMAEITAKNTREELSLKGDIAETVSVGEAFESAQKYGNQKSGSPILDGIRSLIRPVITVYLLVITSYFGYSIHQLLGGFDILSPTELLALYKEIIVSMLALTNMSVAFWFGSRANNRTKVI
tara:strand:- start:1708 stop:2199 length:492 start_codon:yes stop_codon:yes gene_type:complete